VAHRYLVNCSILFTDLPLLERPAAARAAGFDTVEFWWPFADAAPADRDVDAFVSAITDAGVQLAGLNLHAGDMAAGDRGLVSWPGRESEFRDAVDAAVGIGGRLGVSGFNALYGNRLDGVPSHDQDDLAVEHLRFAARAAAAIGAQVWVEPLSAAGRYPLRTATDVHDVLERVGEPTVTMLADLHHLAVNGDDVQRAITAFWHLIGHVQIADAPGRGEPGTGGLPLARWLDDLHACGYAGRVSLEYRAATDDPFGWLPVSARSGS
jgi:hydroxypyruvate isomerase